MNRYYVVGNKASQSLSPIIFNYWFKKYKLKATYGFIEPNNKNFDKKIKEVLSNKNTKGLNITIPFKQKIIKYIDSLDKHSKNINAVNCVTIKSKIKGTNTDWFGYYKTLPKLKNFKKNKILLIGYGGAAHAIHYVLKTKGFKNIVVINRTRKILKFEKMKKHTLGLKNLDKHLPNADLIINTTPTNPIRGKKNNLIRKKTLLSDIVYKPKETSFLKSFPKNKKIYGISMLLEQALPCFKIWFGFNPIVDTKLLYLLDQKIK